MLPIVFAAGLALRPTPTCPTWQMPDLRSLFSCWSALDASRLVAHKVDERIQIFGLRTRRRPTPGDYLALFEGDPPVNPWGHPLRYVPLAQGYDVVDLGRDGAWGSACGHPEDEDRSVHGVLGTPW